MASSSGTATGTGSTCGACKFLRRKCTFDCVFGPFAWNKAPQGSQPFTKCLGRAMCRNCCCISRLMIVARLSSVITVAYEAEARIRDAVNGCIAQIFALQQQVACLQAQLMQVKGQLAQNNAVNSSQNIRES